MKPVKGFEKYYSVTDDGRVYSNWSNKFLKPRLNKNGYLYVSLKGDGKFKYAPIHRLVATAYVDKEDGRECVNHINEIKTDNRASNLEWCTKAYNNTYNGKTQRCCKKILQIDPTTGETTLWNGARKPASLGIANYKNISAVCRGKRKSAGGYLWRFI